MAAKISGMSVLESLLTLWLCVASFLVGSILWRWDEAESWRRECVSRGVAEYARDPNGDIVWRWTAARRPDNTALAGLRHVSQ